MRERVAGGVEQAGSCSGQRSLHRRRNLWTAGVIGKLFLLNRLPGRYNPATHRVTVSDN